MQRRSRFKADSLEAVAACDLAKRFPILEFPYQEKENASHRSPAQDGSPTDFR
jgi:hypothetical protein